MTLTSPFNLGSYDPLGVVKETTIPKKKVTHTFYIFLSLLPAMALVDICSHPLSSFRNEQRLPEFQSKSPKILKLLPSPHPLSLSACTRTQFEWPVQTSSSTASTSWPWWLVTCCWMQYSYSSPMSWSSHSLSYHITGGENQVLVDLCISHLCCLGFLHLHHCSDHGAPL